MRAFSVVFLMALVGVVVLLAVENQQAIELTLFNQWRFTLSVALLVGASYLLGFLTGGTVVGMIRRSLHELTGESRQHAHAR